MRNWKRILCLILCVLMVLPLEVLTVFAAGESDLLNTGAELLADSSEGDGMNAVTTTEKVTIDGLDYVIERTTRCIGTRTYSVQIHLRSDVESSDAPTRISAAQNGYMTVIQSGWYLLELWGGDGADGSDTEGMSPDNIFERKIYEGGDGGNGGYVYAKIWLDAGQTLVYTIGTNGSQSQANDDAGGENGEGGVHGSGGNRLVGGGGGFSALYFFDKGEFNEEWVTSTAIEIPEAARLSKYILIAGGGGGGGAGAGTTIAPYSDNSAPNGGMGGSIFNGAAVTLRGSDYAVEGVIFSGRNGSSSYNSNAYVGIGGSSVPGPKVDTNLGLAEDQIAANDWTGTYSTDSAYGAGGSGNFRGGGGGAGFTGGSGGNMAGSLVPSNVGGGGGGSSFIADHVTYLDANGNLATRSIAYRFDANDVATPYLMPSDVSDSKRHVGVGVGGACEVTYLGNDDALALDALQNVTMTTTISRYFTVNQGASSSTGSLSYSTNSSTGVTTVTATGLDITPADSKNGAQIATVNLILVAADSFVGGNAVEMVRGITASFKDPHDTSKNMTVYAKEDDSLDFVNVPLRLTLNTKSYTTSVVGKSYAVTSFYEDSYASVRDSLSSYWQYDYIQSISSYSVLRNGSTVTGNVSVSTTTTFVVRYTVQLKSVSTSALVTVGPANETTTVNSKNAVVSIVPAQTASLNSITTTASRGLEYRNGQYLFSVNLDQLTSDIEFPYSTVKSASSGSGQYEVKISGWYYIQVWGGNGRASQGTRTKRYNGNTRVSVAGASGGAGGYVSGYIYLEAGTYIDYVAGAAYTDPTGYYDGPNCQHPSALASVGYSASSGGSGGNYSSVSIGGTVYMVAGGGGGGGGSAAASTTGASNPITGQGTAGKQNTTISNELVLDSDGTISTSTYKGKNGYSGSAYAKYPVISNSYYANGGSGGNGGANYRYAALTEGFDSTSSGKTLSSEAWSMVSSYTTSKSSGKAGQISITLLESDTATAEREKLSEATLEVAISQYFDVAGITISGATGASISYTATPVNMGTGNGTATVLSIDADYNASVVKKSSGGVEYIVYKASPTIVIALEPKEGFLGGNDVPVILSGLLGGSSQDANDLPECGLRVTKGDDFLHSPGVNSTDYANVELSFEFETDVGQTPIFEVHDQTIMLGDSLYESQLYTANIPTYTGEDAWKDNFVSFEVPTDDGNALLTPQKTEFYSLGVRLIPKANASLAVIQASVAEIEYALPVTVFVNVRVAYELENLSVVADDVIPYGTEYRFLVKAETGYLLPDAITVYVVNGEQRTAVPAGTYHYDATSGEVVLSNLAVIGHLEIIATAKIKTYSIHVGYLTNLNQQNPYELVDNNGGAGYAPGAPIDVEALLTGIAPTPAEGYTYVWSYDTEDGSCPSVMPASDLWIYGSYEKNLYTLTVLYRYENGTQAAPDDSRIVAYGDSYSVTSPTVKGYKADLPIVSGTQGADNLTVTVTYTASSNEVTILFVKKDGTQALPTVTDSLSTGETRTYDIVKDYPLAGYTPQESSLTVTMEGESVTLIVTYTPNQYEIHFQYAFGLGESPDLPDVDFSAATLNSSDEKFVEFDNVYSYDAENGLYTGLPTPYIAGYSFEGWYLNGTKITDTSAVVTAGDHNLVAKWSRQKFKLTIQYEFCYENGDYLPDGKSLDTVLAELASKMNALSVDAMIEYGTSYSIDSLSYTGYTPYVDHGLISQANANVVTGVMPAQNRLIIVEYWINVYTVTFEDAPGVGIEYSDWDGTGTKPSSVAADQYDRVWATVEVKHNVIPVYPLGENGVVLPYQNSNQTQASYSYEFLGWISSGSGSSYNDVDAVLENATQNCSYYTRFYATENIVGVTVGSTTYYFTTVADALAYARANLASVSKMIFRRNAHCGKEIVLDGDPLVLDSTFTTTADLSLTVDLAGFALITTNGQSVIENRCTVPLDLVLTSSSGSTGALVAQGSGNVIALDSASGALTVSSAISISAFSADADATAVRFATKDGSSFTASAKLNLTATAENGTAIGLHLADTEQASSAYSTLSSSAHLISATGKIAYGVKSAGSASFGSSSYGYGGSIFATGVEEAYGISGTSALYLSSTAQIDARADGTDAIAVGLNEVASFNATGSALTVNATALNGTAYGYVVSDDVTLSYGTFNVNGDKAYGIVIRDGGSVALRSVTLDVDGSSLAVGVENLSGGSLSCVSGYTATLLATATDGDAYGLRNYGSVSSLALTGTVSGSQNAYGIYNEGGTVTASGVASSTSLVAIAAGGQGIGLYSMGGSIGSEADPLCVGAFSGTTYGIYCTDGSIVVSGDELFFKGANENDALVESTATEGESPNGVVILPGYLQAAANTDSPYVGYYRLGREWTITFVTNGGSEIVAITQIFDTPLTKPQAPYKSGYDFVDWYSDEELSVLYNFPTKMPNGDQTLYAKWSLITYTYTLESEGAKVEYSYNVEMGDVILTIPDKDDFQFLGWSNFVSTSDNGEMFLKLTPNSVEEFDAWRNREILDLYAQWDEITWEGFLSVGREMLPALVVSKDMGAIRNDGTITLRFHTVNSVSVETYFTFSGGLTEGTILTLADCSEDGRVQYYSYTVTENGVCQVLASSFLLMGTRDVYFAGASNHVMLQICYANSLEPVAEERVGIVTSDLTPEVEISYRLIETAVSPGESEQEVLDYLEDGEETLTLPALTDKGFSPEDRVVVRITWGELSMAPGVIFAIGEHYADFLSASGALIDTGLTVADVTEEQSLTLRYRFDTMRFMEFENLAFRYEICVMPSGKYDTMRTMYALDILLVAEISKLVTVTETPSLTVKEESMIMVSPGDVLTVQGISGGDDVVVSFYEYDVESGSFIFSNACGILFDRDAGFVVGDGNELIRMSESGERMPLITDGVLEAAISTGAVPGRYYLKLVCGDKHVFVPFRVWSADTAEA